jgi:hypothetical protein
MTERQTTGDALLSRLSDTLELQKLKAVYCRAADMVVRDPVGARAILEDVFLPDATADYGVVICNGRTELLDYLVAAINGHNEWLQHFITTPLIEVDGDAATGDWALIVQLKQKHMSGKEMLVGRYSDRFRRTAAGWKISAITFAEEGVYHLVPLESLGAEQPRHKT